MESDSDDDLSEAEKDLMAEDISELEELLRHLRKDPRLYLKYGWQYEKLLLRLKADMFVEPNWAPFDFHAQDHIFSYRFGAHEISRLASLLPDVVEHPDERRRVKCDARTALCVCLARLASPMRWKALRPMFGGRSISWLSSVYHATLDLLFVHARKELWSFSPNFIDEIPRMVEACHEKFGMRCWGFMDGNHADLSRPSFLQRAFYSGYEGHHLLRALAIVRPDGLFECAFGPFPGAGSDTSMFNAISMDLKLRQLHAHVARTYFLLPSEEVCILADSIFVATKDVLTPYDYADLQASLPANASLNVLAERQRRRFYNLIHSQTRIAVEWGFGRVLNNWQALSFKAHMKVHHTSPEKAMLVAMLLTNFIVVSRGAQHQEYFGVPSQSFEEYLEKVIKL